MSNELSEMLSHFGAITAMVAILTLFYFGIAEDDEC